MQLNCVEVHVTGLTDRFSPAHHIRALKLES